MYVTNDVIWYFTAGARGCLRGGAIGLGITTAYVLMTSGDKVKTMIGR